MASNLTTQGQEVVKCDLCQNPVSFFCRRCGVSLCDSCVPDHLRISRKDGHDVIDFTKKEEKIEGLMKRFLKTIVWIFFLFTLLIYFLFISENSKGWIATHIIHFFDTSMDTGLPAAECKIDENDMKNYFGNIEKMLESKCSMLEKRFISDPDLGRKVKEVPSVSSIIDTGFFVDEEYYIRLFDMAVTDDQKVWMVGHNNELKLFDLEGNLHRRVTTTWYGNHICMYNEQLLYSDWLKKSVMKMSDDDTELTMFTTGDWTPYGITESASGDLLVCLRKGEKSKVVRYSSTVTVLQEIQYDSHGQPLYQAAWYIAKNVNGDIIVTDVAKQNVIAVNILGIFRYIYTGRNNDIYACSVATDSVGHIYVTDITSNRIHMLDRDGRFLRYIIPEGGIKAPRPVCMIGDEMIVGEGKTGLVKRIKLFE